MSAADNAALLVSLGTLIIRRSSDLHALVRGAAFTGGEPGSATGVPLGRYNEGAAPRTVVLVHAEKLREPPTVAEQSIDTVFDDAVSPPPRRGMTRARFAAIHLGLCRLLERVASDILPPFSFFAAALVHPLLERARATVCHARQHGGAPDADWVVPPRPCRWDEPGYSSAGLQALPGAVSHHSAKMRSYTMSHHLVAQRSYTR